MEGVWGGGGYSFISMDDLVKNMASDAFGF